MNKNQKEKLLQYKKITITLDELLEIFHDESQTYEQIADIISEMEKSEVLQIVKSQGRSTRTPYLAYRYRYFKDKILRQEHAYLNRFSTNLNLDEYYKLPESIFLQDKPYIERIDAYLSSSGIPTIPAPIPERSAQLVGDEKWISEKGGMDVLKRLKLWEKLLVLPVSDPLMMAIHPKNILKTQHYHLIVENKTTFQALIGYLPTTCFTTLIYGCGNKIVKSLEQFPYQIPGIQGSHTFFYFGDIDHSGLTIWHSLMKRQPVALATPFYEACLIKTPFKGKDNQRRDEFAIDAFERALHSKVHVSLLLEKGFYFPQEILTTQELQRVWEDWSCRILNTKK
jgi:hypothetical protein